MQPWRAFPRAQPLLMSGVAPLCGGLDTRGQDPRRSNNSEKVLRNFVILACQSCHSCSTAFVPKEEAAERLDRVVRLASSKLAELEGLTNELKQCVQTAKQLQGDVALQPELSDVGLDMLPPPVPQRVPDGAAQREAEPEGGEVLHEGPDESPEVDPGQVALERVHATPWEELVDTEEEELPPPAACAACDGCGAAAKSEGKDAPGARTRRRRQKRQQETVAAAFASNVIHESELDGDPVVAEAATKVIPEPVQDGDSPVAASASKVIHEPVQDGEAASDSKVIHDPVAAVIHEKSQSVPDGDPVVASASKVTP